MCREDCLKHVHWSPSRTMWTCHRKRIFFQLRHSLLDDGRSGAAREIVHTRFPFCNNADLPNSWSVKRLGCIDHVSPALPCFLHHRGLISSCVIPHRMTACNFFREVTVCIIEVKLSFKSSKQSSGEVSTTKCQSRHSGHKSVPLAIEI
jgi:hypothetical protein